MVPFGGPPNRGTFLSLLSAQSEYLRKVSHSVRAFWSQRRWRLRLRLHVVFFFDCPKSDPRPPPHPWCRGEWILTRLERILFICSVL